MGSANDSIYIAVNGKSQGPFDVDTIKAFISNGWVKNNTLAWKSGMANWAEISTLSEFASSFVPLSPLEAQPAQPVDKDHSEFLNDKEHNSETSATDKERQNSSPKEDGTTIPKTDLSYENALARQGLSVIAKVGIAATVVVVIALAVWLLIPKDDGKSDVIVSTIPTSNNDYIAQEAMPFSIDFESAMGTCSYTGPVDSDGKPHGTGRAIFSDGRSYQGPFIHGVAEGDNATFIYPGNGTFQGSFHADKFKEGRYTFADDSSYFVGSFKDGQPDVGTYYNKWGQAI